MYVFKVHIYIFETVAQQPKFYRPIASQRRCVGDYWNGNGKRSNKIVASPRELSNMYVMLTVLQISSMIGTSLMYTIVVLLK